MDMQGKLGGVEEVAVKSKKPLKVLSHKPSSSVTAYILYT